MCLESGQTGSRRIRAFCEDDMASVRIGDQKRLWLRFAFA